MMRVVSYVGGGGGGGCYCLSLASMVKAIGDIYNHKEVGLVQ
jgi:hypothetical protein